MCDRKKRSSYSQLLVTQGRVSQELAKAQPQGLSEFTGDASEVDLDYWMQRFERSLYSNNLYMNGEHAANYFGTFLTGTSYNWYHAQPDHIKTSFKALKIAFKRRFNTARPSRQSAATRLASFERHIFPPLSIEDAQPGPVFWDWLDHLQDLASQIAQHEVSAPILAEKAWRALPLALRKEIGRPPSSIQMLTRACEELSTEQYEMLLHQSEQAKLTQTMMRLLEANNERLNRVEQDNPKDSKHTGARERSRFCEAD